MKERNGLKEVKRAKKVKGLNEMKEVQCLRLCIVLRKKLNCDNFNFV